jgi:hypothetical protein
MMYRTTPQGLVCITQPAHAWISGQLARQWGNDRFGRFTPWEAVCLGAEQHDIGWLKWEANPSFNAETGYPHSFMELPTESHIALWSTASGLALPYGRYVALLVSLHGTKLYERHTSWQQSESLRPIVQQFLTQERDFQQQTLHTLKQDSYYHDFVKPETIACNQKLVSIWDWFSLLLCMGLTQPKQIDQIPLASIDTTLTLTPMNPEATKIAVEPWCFQSDRVELTLEGRLLQTQSQDYPSMRHQLETAPWITLNFQLCPK